MKMLTLTLAFSLMTFCFILPVFAPTDKTATEEKIKEAEAAGEEVVKGKTPGKTKRVVIQDDGKVKVVKEDGTTWEMISKPSCMGWVWKRVTPGPAGSMTSQSSPAGAEVATSLPSRPPLGPGIQPKFQNLRGKDGSLLMAIEPWEVWWTRNREKYLTGIRMPVKWQEESQTSTITKFQIYDDLFNLLVKGLEDKVENIAVMSAVGLGKSGDTRAIDILKTTYQKETRPMVKDNILLALGLLRDVSSIPLIKEAIYDKKSDEVSRSYATLSLGYLNDPAALQILKDIVSSKEKLDLEVTAAACLSIGLSAVGTGRQSENASTDTVNALVTLLNPEKKKDRRIRCCAALGLGRIGSKESFKGLEKAVSDKDDEVRASIAVALG
ncbi:MAG: HEAT repeat domain-containing protein, partial [Planctomycetes bacterium]|nr:HEAT repeat domain-containing protein [Planctomycetota bacterium]